MPKTAVQRRRMATRLARIHLALTVVWILLIIPTLLWWHDSILWVASISVYANVAAHASGYQGARAEMSSET